MILTKNQPGTMHRGSYAENRVIRLMAFVEAGTVTGPAKNLFEFCRRARNLRNHGRAGDQVPEVLTTIATFDRGRDVTTRRYQGSPSTQLRSARDVPNEFVATACQAGIDVDVIGERFVFDWAVVSKMRRLVEEHSPDILQTHSVKSHLLMRVSGLWRERPWVAFHHGYTTPNVKMRAYNQLDRWSLRVPDQVITVSQAFAGQLMHSGVSGERIHVLHNSINPDWTNSASPDKVSALRSSLGIDDDERVILSVGRLSHEKAHVDLVSAVARLRQTHPGLRIKLVIVGEGPERDRIEQTAAELGVQNLVILAGQVSQVSVYFEMTDLFVLPSLSEGSPNVLLEAMAASLPIIATAVGGIPEIVTHNESALLVEPHAPDMLAETIAGVLIAPDVARSLAEKARALAIEHYSPESRMHALIDIYDRIARASKSKWKVL